LNVLDDYANVIKNLSIIGGILVAGISLIYSQYDRRLTRTFDFYKDYKETIRPDYLKLIVDWNVYARAVPGFQQLPHDGVKDVVVKFFAGKPDDETKLENVLDFYDTLYVCVKNRSCNKNSVIDLMGKQIEATYEMAAYYIAEVREKDRDRKYGEGLEQLYRAEPESLVRELL
jgi:hypothetical protein